MVMFGALIFHTVSKYLEEHRPSVRQILSMPHSSWLMHFFLQLCVLRWQYSSSAHSLVLRQCLASGFCAVSGAFAAGDDASVAIWSVGFTSSVFCAGASAAIFDLHDVHDIAAISSMSHLEKCGFFIFLFVLSGYSLMHPLKKRVRGNIVINPCLQQLVTAMTRRIIYIVLNTRCHLPFTC